MNNGSTKLNSANELYTHARRLRIMGRAAEAIPYFEAALRLEPGHPDIIVELGNAQLIVGNDEPGWANYQARRERRMSPANSLGFPEWEGEPLEGKRLFLWREQGLGDQIFAARYVPGLAARRTLMVCEEPLAPLFSQLPVDVEPRSATYEVRPEHEFWTLPLSLPQWVRATPCPYLHAEPRRMGSVGIMWRGNSLPDPGRSLPEALAAQLLAIPGAFSLQPEDTGAEDFLATAQMIAGADLVITIDTSVAHLVGALGKRGIVLLQHYPNDWRWREASPGRSSWYPSLELWRQPEPGAWDPLIERAIRKTAEIR